MNGMLSFADAPAFHALVDRRDYRIVCVFEVFSQNRSEDDFLENLALIAQIIKEQDLAANGPQNAQDAQYNLNQQRLTEEEE